MQARCYALRRRQIGRHNLSSDRDGASAPICNMQACALGVLHDAGVTKQIIFDGNMAANATIHGLGH
jgi:hypothetical protein